MNEGVIGMLDQLARRGNFCEIDSLGFGSGRVYGFTADNTLCKKVRSQE